MNVGWIFDVSVCIRINSKVNCLWMSRPLFPFPKQQIIKSESEKKDLKKENFGKLQEIVQSLM